MQRRRKKKYWKKMLWFVRLLDGSCLEGVETFVVSDELLLLLIPNSDEFDRSCCGKAFSTRAHVK